MATIFTLDDAHSLDLDDALEFEPLDNGNVKIKVFIADVAATVPKGHKHDAHAHEVVETKYWDGGNTPMLPRFLAENRLSLLPAKSRKGIQIRAVLDRDLALVEPVTLKLRPLVSKHKVAYADVPGILGDKTHPLHADLRAGEALAKALLEKRRNDGALVFYDLNAGWATTEEGILLKLERAKANVGYIIVQEMMILANMLVAAYCAEQGIPILFRNHTAKPIAPERIEMVGQLNDAHYHPESIEVLRKRIHLVMNRAEYSPLLTGHYGLNLPAYMHFTSPIRRFADLVNHRQIRARLEGKDLPYSDTDLPALAQHINEKVQANRDRKAEEMKASANERGERRAATMEPARLAALKPTDFERVLKAALRPTAFNPDVAEAARLRLQSGTLAILDMFLILCTSPLEDEGWTELRASLLQHLTEQPHHAASIASLGMNILGWSPMDFQHERSGPDHAPRFRVVASLTTEHGPLTSNPVIGASLKEAKQRATLNLLSERAGFKLPPLAMLADLGVERESLLPPPSAPVKPLPPIDTANPVSALQEVAQARKLPLPTYADARVGGEDHTPLFTVTCAFHGIERTSPPSASKKEGKKEAARLVLAGLQEAEI